MHRRRLRVAIIIAIIISIIAIIIYLVYNACNTATKHIFTNGMELFSQDPELSYKFMSQGLASIESFPSDKHTKVLTLDELVSYNERFNYVIKIEEDRDIVLYIPIMSSINLVDGYLIDIPNVIVGTRTFRVISSSTDTSSVSIPLRKIYLERYR